MKMKYYSIMLCCVLCLALLPITALAKTENHPVFSIAVDKAGMGLGQDIHVTVTGEHLENSYGYELRLIYDDERLLFKSADSNWKGFSVPAIKKDGEIVFAHSLIGNTPGVFGKTDIARFAFKTIAEGDAELKLTRVELVDATVNSKVYQPDISVVIPIISTQVIKTFHDMDGHWARKQVERLNTLGIVNGYPDGSFRPSESINRAEFVAMLARAVHLQAQGASNIADFIDYEQIPAWAKPYIADAVSAGVVVGYPDRSFRATNKITRSELVVMALKSTGQSVISKKSLSYADEAQIPSWAYPYIAAATENGLIKGRGNNKFAPNEWTTRAEAATIILTLLELE